MSIKLSDMLKSRQSSLRLKKDDSLREQAKVYAAILKAKEEERKREIEEAEERERNKLLLAKQAELERLRQEREANTRRYFEFNRVERRVPPPRKPVYYGELVLRNSSWQAHGEGEFYLDGKIKMKGTFRKGEFSRGRLRWDSSGREIIEKEANDNDEDSDGHSDTRSVGSDIIYGEHNEQEQGGGDEATATSSSSSSKHNLGDGYCWWEGGMRGSMMDGVGTIVTATGERKPAIAYKNEILCLKEELVNGRQLRFNECSFNIYPSQQHRTPTASIVEHIRGWVFRLRFDDEVWPREREIDLSSNINFTMPSPLPMAYHLRSFGFDAETDRVYDHRRSDQVDRERVRDTAENLLRIQTIGTYDSYQQQRQAQRSIAVEGRGGVGGGRGGSVSGKPSSVRLDSLTIDSGLSDSFDMQDGLSEHSEATRDSQQLFGVPVTGSSSSSKHGTPSRSAVSFNNDSTDSFDLSGKSNRDSPQKQHQKQHQKQQHGTRKKICAVTSEAAAYRMQVAIEQRRRRLIDRFPVRAHKDRMESIFEAKQIGVGAAKEEEEKAIQDELRKQQWKELIEERRARMEEERQQRIEEEHRSITEQSLAESRKSKQAAKLEEEEHSRRTQQAVEDALEELSQQSSRPASRATTAASNPPALTIDEATAADDDDDAVKNS